MPFFLKQGKISQVLNRPRVKFLNSITFYMLTGIYACKQKNYLIFFILNLKMTDNYGALVSRQK